MCMVVVNVLLGHIQCPYDHGQREHFLFTHMKNEAGDIEALKKGTANTFAKFYEDQYSSGSDERKDEKDNEGRLVRTFVTMLTMMKILKTMNRTITSQNLP